MFGPPPRLWELVVVAMVLGLAGWAFWSVVFVLLKHLHWSWS